MRTQPTPEELIAACPAEAHDCTADPRCEGFLTADKHKLSKPSEAAAKRPVFVRLQACWRGSDAAQKKADAMRDVFAARKEARQRAQPPRKPRTTCHIKQQRLEYWGIGRISRSSRFQLRGSPQCRASLPAVAE